MNKANLIRREVKEVTLKNVERYARTKSWSVQYYGDGGAADQFLASVEMLEYAQSVDSFTYLDGLRRIIFIKHDFQDNQRLFLLLHEIGHLILGHNIGRLSFEDEREANRFAEKCLRPVYPKCIVIVSIIAAVMCILFFGSIALNDVSPDETADNYYNSDLVYITEHGEKFHRADCMYVESKNNVISITRSEALRIGKEPCKVCRP